MDSKTIQRYKKRNLSWLRKKATELFNRWIRERDSENGFGRCISCRKGLRIPSQEAHAGHFKSGGHFPRLRYNPDNVHLQCIRCNYFLSGNLDKYRRNLIEKIGIERVLKLDMIAQDRTPFKWDRFYLIEIIEQYR